MKALKNKDCLRAGHGAMPLRWLLASVKCQIGVRELQFTRDRENSLMVRDMTTFKKTKWP